MLFIIRAPVCCCCEREALLLVMLSAIAAAAAMVYIVVFHVISERKLRSELCWRYMPWLAREHCCYMRCALAERRHILFFAAIAAAFIIMLIYIYAYVMLLSAMRDYTEMV